MTNSNSGDRLNQIENLLEQFIAASVADCHACGHYLASKGQDTRAIQAYLEHKNIQHTVRYTEVVPGRFNDFWHD